MIYGLFQNFEKEPSKIWEIVYELRNKVAQPNEAHRALAYLEKEGHLRCIFTQNIENLHQQAGSKCVFEFHGNAREMICTTCRKMDNLKLGLSKAELPPKCQCGGIYKPVN